MKLKFLWMFSTFAIVMMLNACGGGGGTSDNSTGTNSTGTMSVSVSLSFPAVASNIQFQALGTYTDVVSVELVVTETSPGSSTHFTGELSESGGDWTVTATNLPVGPTLSFTASAYDAVGGSGGAGTKIFEGTTSSVVLVSGGSNTITINLDPIDDAATNVLPKITNITRPADISADSNATVSFSFAGNNDEVLDYLITPEVNGGNFDSTNDSITMNGAGTNTMDVTYTAPGPAFIGDKTHSVKLTNSQNNWVAMQFNTNVVIETVDDTVVTALFSPVIDTMGGERTSATSTVTWTITTVDDGSINTYLWTKQSGLASATFSVNDAAIATMTGYDPTESGVIRVAITDDDALTTTVDYEVALDQFPDNVVVDTP